MNNVHFFISLLIYSSWNIYVMSDRVTRYPAREHPFKFFLDVLYFSLMTYYLSFASTSFLLLGLLSLVAQIAFGFSVEVFRPDLLTNDLSADLMKNYWNYIVCDSLIAFTAFCIVYLGA